MVHPLRANFSAVTKCQKIGCLYSFVRKYRFVDAVNYHKTWQIKLIKIGTSIEKIARGGTTQLYEGIPGSSPNRGGFNHRVRRITSLGCASNSVVSFLSHSCGRLSCPGRVCSSMPLFKARGQCHLSIRHSYGPQVSPFNSAATWPCISRQEDLFRWYP